MSCDYCGKKGIEELKDLFEFMKENNVIRAKKGDIELELGPAAFYEKIVEPPPIPAEDNKEYEQFLFPKVEEMDKLGL